MKKIDSNENFIRMIEQYQNLIFSLCLKLTGDYFAAEDLTQDTFVAAYQHLEEFDGAAEKAWLCRIAANKCVDYKRRAARKELTVTEEDMPAIQADLQAEPLQQILNQEVLKELENYCDALAPPYGEVARLHFLEGKKAKEIAEMSGVGIKTVQTRIYRARELLKKLYGKEKPK